MQCFTNNLKLTPLCYSCWVLWKWLTIKRHRNASKIPFEEFLFYFGKSFKTGKAGDGFLNIFQLFPNSYSWGVSSFYTSPLTFRAFPFNKKKLFKHSQIMNLTKLIVQLMNGSQIQLVSKKTWEFSDEFDIVFNLWISNCNTGFYYYIC